MTEIKQYYSQIYQRIFSKPLVEPEGWTRIDCRTIMSETENNLPNPKLICKGQIAIMNGKRYISDGESEWIQI